MSAHIIVGLFFLARVLGWGHVHGYRASDASDDSFRRPFRRGRAWIEPAAAATMSGVMAAWCAITVQSAPACTRAVTTSTAPTSAAMWQAVTPRESCALGSAFASSKALTSSRLVCPQPAIKAVRPSYRAVPT